MKTAKTGERPRKRYEKVMDAYGECRMYFIKETGISENDYIDMEFETGCALVEQFYKDRDPEVGQKYMRQLLEDKSIGFWPWFKNQRSQRELQFMHRNTFQHQIEKGAYAEDLAAKRLIQKWKVVHRKMTKDKDVHKRLLIFIMNNKTFRVRQR